MGIVLAFALVSGGLGIFDLETGAAGVTPYGALTEQFGDQYEALRSELPPRGTVGFVSETNDDLAYVLAHYNLAPLIVRRWANESIVVGHFQSRDAASGFLSRTEYTQESPADAELHVIVVAR